MSDHADTVRDGLVYAAAMMRGLQSDVAHHTDLSPEIERCEGGRVALMALVADLAEARMGERGWKATAETYLTNCEAAEAEADKLKAALEEISWMTVLMPDGSINATASYIARAALAPADPNTT